MKTWKIVVLSALFVSGSALASGNHSGGGGPSEFPQYSSPTLPQVGNWDAMIHVYQSGNSNGSSAVQSSAYKSKIDVHQGGSNNTSVANQTGDAQWLRTYEELRQERDEGRLCERALAQLMDFADRQGKRILLVVENLNMILSDQLKEADAWRLRKTLMHEPRLMLLATATARLDGPQNLQKAMYELFKTQELHPLDDADCQAIWRSIAGHDLGPRRIRAISILTGGSPRLLAIISHFGARMSFSELMRDMTSLVDDHTDYFKSHLDALPSTERKVYV
ncbi:MAG: hypothetical protein EOM46_19385, partial [Gammaproteobacteria bacterium]|nr:hypothetical protein [Gammaproteobacteria bacterium]